jgi:L1 cell adhesion molecule like protein
MLELLAETHIWVEKTLINEYCSFFYNKYIENFQISDKETIKRALVRLKIKCEKHKWILTRVSFATISLSALLPGWDFKETMKRTDFEKICIDLFKKTIRIVDETLKNANVNKSEITEIVLIRGSTKIPQIQNLLKDYFKEKPLNKQIKPDEAVAYGATVQAALLNGEKFSQLFSIIPHDVAPFSLGIELKDKSMSVIIPRYSKLPIVRSQRFFTAEDKQTYVFIQIFEGENFKTAKHNRLLGSFTIDGLPKKSK